MKTLHIHPAHINKDDYYLKDVLIKDIWQEYMEKDIEPEDKVVIDKYKKQMTKGKYEPVAVCFQSQDDPIIDGCHRVQAAYELGMKTIKAYVCKEGGEIINGIY